MRLYYLSLQATREGQASFAHVHEIVRGLVKRGWQVCLFEPDYGRCGTLPGPAGRLLEFIRAQKHIWMQKPRPNVIYIRWHFASWPTALWARWRGLPVVQEVNGPYEDVFIAWPWTRPFAWLFLALMRSQLKWAKAVITVTRQLADWVVAESGNRKVHVIPNGANTDLFQPGLCAPEGSDRGYALFFGSLASWQGIETMLEAVARSDWPEQVSLVIAGDGAEKARVEAAAAQNPKIHYLGLCSYHDMPRIISDALCGLSPKNNRGFRSLTGLSPLKVYETLACGVPVVVSDFPGVADLVRENGIGLIIPPSDAKALASAVTYLHGHPSEGKRMGQRGRRLVEWEHSWDRRAADTAEVLKRICCFPGGD
jgi:glycosyltransferase involved in cell wall biosynthesis